MYMKKGQIAQIRDAAEEIKRLATMETCGLKLDDDTREKVWIWVQWFDRQADKINMALDGEILEKYR